MARNAQPSPPERTVKAAIQLRPYQAEVFRQELRRLFLLWSRQRGKSHLLACQALDWMMEDAGILVTFISASIVLGTEVLLKEAAIWSKMIDMMRAAAEQANLNLTTSVDGLDFDGVCDKFEHSKLETKLWHSNTICSRSRVIAPNPDTAVGWTGHIIGDEVGRWPNAREVMEAVTPFMSSNPKFKLRYATTPPPDDKHYTYEQFIPPAGHEFPVNPRGTFYRSASGILCHRVDVWDGHAAGVSLYDDDTGKPVSPEESRKKASDKQAWDRNFALMFLIGGTAAISPAAIARAMEIGAGVCVGVNITEGLEL